MKKSLIILWIILFSSMIPLLNGQGLPGPIVYSVPGMDKVEVHPNLVYKKDGASEMKMDIYTPPGLAANELRPAVIFIHGGPIGQPTSPGPKDWPFYQSYGKLIAASGLIGITLDHRYLSLPGTKLCALT
jgi:hypothetical protein